MKPEIHPSYQDVVFMDSSVDPPYRVLTKSTRTSEEMIEWEDGNSYPLIRVEISSASHPFYTGKMKYVDSAGRVEKFQKKYNWGKNNPASVRLSRWILWIAWVCARPSSILSTTQRFMSSSSMSMAVVVSMIITGPLTW